MKVRALVLLGLLTLSSCAVNPADTNETRSLKDQSSETSRYTPLAAMTVIIDEETAENRVWPTVGVFVQKDNEEQRVLVEEIGKVGEYPGDFEFSPDKKSLFINLESRLVAVDLETGEQKDVFIPKKQIESYVFVDDGKKIIVWDQLYASQDFEYFVHEVDLATGESQQIHQGDADGRYFFINKLRDDGMLLLVQAAGEASSPWLFDLNTKDLKPVPEHENPALYVGYSGQGKYLIVPDQMLGDACNELFGAAPSVYAFIDPLTGETVGTIGDEAMHTQIIAMSDDDSEVLYAEFLPSTDPQLCKTPTASQSFYRASVVGDGRPEPVANHLVLFSKWAPERAGFDYIPLTEGGASLVYYDQPFVTLSSGQNLVSTTVIQ